MPVVPVEQNRVGLAEVSGAKFRTPNLDGTGGEGLAKAVGIIGQAVGQYAADQDALQDHADKIYARDMALQYKQEALRRVGEYKSLRGRDAMDNGVAVQKGLGEYGQELLGKAGNPRARSYLEEFIKPAELEFSNSIADHARGEQFEFSKSTYASGVAMAGEQAALRFGDPEKQAAHIAEGNDNLDRLARLEGWDAGTLSAKRLEFTSKVHGAVIDQLLLQTDGGVDQALTYFKAHEGSMSVAARNDVLKSLQSPLQKRQAEADFWEVASGAKTEVGDRQQVELPGGTYRIPVAGRVSNTFAQHQARGSAGLDIAAPVGSAVKPMAGGTVKVGEDPRSGKFVIVTHPDGTTSSYSHLGNISVKDGAVVGPDVVIGTVGMTGKTSGPHLHLRVKDKSGKDMDPQKVLGAEAKGGSIVAGQGDARNWDQAGVLAAIDARADWSPERRAAARDFARSRMSQDESALADKYQDAEREAAMVIARLGDGFTSTAQIPAAVRAQMDPVKLAQLDADIRKAKEAEAKKREGDAQSINATQLDLMARFRPEQFKKLDPLAQAGKLAPAQFNSFLIKWMDANKPADFVEEDLRGKVNGEISFQETRGAKIGDKEKVALHDYMMAQLRAIHAAKGKGAITAQDISTAYRSAMRTVPNTGGWFSSDKTNFEILTDVPTDWEAKFRQSWPGKQPPTRSQVIEAWQRFKASGGK